MSNMAQAIDFVDLPYGWKAINGINTNEDSIYNATNQREQVKQVDIIPLVLGTHERCLGTQYQTNSPMYYVAPLTNVMEDWVTTNDSGSYVTNTFTNAIGWYVNQNTMMDVDTKIKALVPYYVDTNTVYDGTTNIVMLTVIGLWASLEIGDHTNKFTRTPCWTNSISTNWIVCYTSYWPSTNGTATNINYTSQYQQVVHYAESWTATGGHIWASCTNWPSEVVQVTNTATYGDYPWQIYKEDLEERYKVLEALRMTRDTVQITTNYTRAVNSNNYAGAVIGYLATNFDKNYNTPVSAGIDNYPSADSITMQRTRGKYYFPGSVLTTNVPIKSFVGKGQIDHAHFLPASETEYFAASDALGEYKEWIDIIPAMINPVSSDFPVTNNSFFNNSSIPPPNGIYTGIYSYGWSIQTPKAFIEWNFQYCTNKYW